MLDNIRRRWLRGADVLVGLDSNEPHDWCSAATIIVGFVVLLPLWLVIVLISWPTGWISEIRENRREGIRTVR